MARAGRTISDVVREIMASLPDVEEFVSHGSPTFRVRGKIFGTYTINHHGDGRVALNLVAPPGAQAALVKMQPKAYFVPAYVGPRGWLGVELDKGLGWQTVREHVKDAYEMVAPAELARAVKKEFRVRPPTRKFLPAEIDPFQGKAAGAVLKKLDAICSRLPETEPGTKFGSPMWRVGKKTFVSTHYYTGRLKLSFWVARRGRRSSCAISDSRCHNTRGRVAGSTWMWKSGKTGTRSSSWRWRAIGILRSSGC